MQYIKKKSPELVEPPVAPQSSTKDTQKPQVNKQVYTTANKSYKEIRTEVSGEQEPVKVDVSKDEPQNAIEQIKKNEIEVNEDTKQIEEQEELTNESVLGIWEEISLLFASEVQISAVVNQIKPELKENEIWFELTSITQKTVFEQSIKPKSLELFREKSGNKHITIQYSCKQDECVEAKPQTIQEKFDYLAQQNPYLEEMKNELDLEIDLP